MKRQTFLTMLLAALLLPAFVMTMAAAGEPQTKTGTVKKVDAAAKQVTVMVTRELTFTCTDATKIQQGGAPKKIEDIKVGAQVSVVYVKDGDTRTAQKLVILGDK